ncbi:MAG: hypothetical protein Q8S84_05645 [bacterium]|nr:hypothetical protein [bacterium]MDP3380966.1 hypothetical protein [bacterium]
MYLVHDHFSCHLSPYISSQYIIVDAHNLLSTIQIVLHQSVADSQTFHSAFKNSALVGYSFIIGDKANPCEINTKNSINTVINFFINS